MPCFARNRWGVLYFNGTVKQGEEFWRWDKRDHTSAEEALKVEP
jgi:hypothetical protein